MSIRYWVLVSDGLMNSEPSWPEFLRPVEPANYEQPGMRWWLFEDDEAPAALDGKRVELTGTLRDGETVIARRPA